jgi:hypothetical protein
MVALQLFIYAIPAFISVTRVINHKHFWSDVIVGGIEGWLFALIGHLVVHGMWCLASVRAANAPGKNQVTIFYHMIASKFEISVMFIISAMFFRFRSKQAVMASYLGKGAMLNDEEAALMDVRVLAKFTIIRHKIFGLSTCQHRFSVKLH